MNFVVGVILIGIVDPEGDGFGDDTTKNQANPPICNDVTVERNADD